ISAMLNRKAEQEWYREKKENDVTQDEIKIVHVPNLGTALLESNFHARGGRSVRRARPKVLGSERAACGGNRCSQSPIFTTMRTATKKAGVRPKDQLDRDHNQQQEQRADRNCERFAK